MHISGKQSKTARGLLKWNVRELEFRSTVRARLIESFEKGLKPLPSTQREMLFKVFKKEGIVFQENGDVRLDEAEKGKSAKHGQGSHRQQETYYIDADSMLAINDVQYRNAKGTGDAAYDSPTLD
jgi:hypothetical protein